VNGLKKTELLDDKIQDPNLFFFHDYLFMNSGNTPELLFRISIDQ